jgi:DNA-binding winged helix-turn-helix (wHTH) protein
MDRGLRHGFRLDDRWVDPEHGRVVVSGHEHALSERSVGFLMALVESPTDVVPYSVLGERLSVGSPDELDRCFEEVRDALGDSDSDPRFVRRDAAGFQLVAAVGIDVPPEPTTQRIL